MEKRLLGFEHDKLAHGTRLHKSAPERSPTWAGQQIRMHVVRARPPHVHVPYPASQADFTHDALLHHPQQTPPSLKGG